MKSLVDFETVQEGGTGAVRWARPDARNPAPGRAYNARVQPARVSVTIITKNEAARLEAALASVAWADEIVVVDAGSTDATAEIARRATGRVFVEGWPGFPQQKNRAADLATHDWILSIDADERVSPALAAEIRAVLAGGPAARGYRIPRVTRAFGRELRATDWYPDWQLRLYDRRAGRWDETPHRPRVGAHRR